MWSLEAATKVLRQLVRVENGATGWTSGKVGTRFYARTPTFILLNSNHHRTIVGHLSLSMSFLLHWDSLSPISLLSPSECPSFSLVILFVKKWQEECHHKAWNGKRDRSNSHKPSPSNGSQRDSAPAMILFRYVRLLSRFSQPNCEETTCYRLSGSTNPILIFFRHCEYPILLPGSWVELAMKTTNG